MITKRTATIVWPSTGFIATLVTPESRLVCKGRLASESLETVRKHWPVDASQI